MTLADRIYEVLDDRPMKFTEILVAVKRRGWTIPQRIKNVFDLYDLFADAMRGDPRFEHCGKEGWRRHGT